MRTGVAPHVLARTRRARPLLCWAAAQAGFSACERTSETALREAFPETPSRDDGAFGLYVRLTA